MSEGNGRFVGKVKWFNTQKGYGFIIPSNETTIKGTDVFVHYSAIEGSGYRQLNEGDDVEFSIEKSKKGLHAKEVIVI